MAEAHGGHAAWAVHGVRVQLLRGSLRGLVINHTWYEAWLRGLVFLTQAYPPK